MWIIDALLFSSSVPVGGPSPPFRGVALSFYRAALHEEDKSWDPLGFRKPKYCIYDVD